MMKCTVNKLLSRAPFIKKKPEKVEFLPSQLVCKGKWVRAPMSLSANDHSSKENISLEKN